MVEDEFIRVAFLTNNEKEAIVKVSSRTEKTCRFRKNRFSRLQRELVQCQQHVKTSSGTIMHRGTCSTDGTCSRCNSKLGLLFDRGDDCCVCELRVCKTCLRNFFDLGIFVCAYCHQIIASKLHKRMMKSGLLEKQARDSLPTKKAATRLMLSQLHVANKDKDVVEDLWQRLADLIGSGGGSTCEESCTSSTLQPTSSISTESICHRGPRLLDGLSSLASSLSSAASHTELVASVHSVSSRRFRNSSSDESTNGSSSTIVNREQDGLDSEFSTSLPNLPTPPFGTSGLYYFQQLRHQHRHYLTSRHLDSQGASCSRHLAYYNSQHSDNNNCCWMQPVADDLSPPEDDAPLMSPSHCRRNLAALVPIANQRQAEWERQQFDWTLTVGSTPTRENFSLSHVEQTCTLMEAMCTSQKLEKEQQESAAAFGSEVQSLQSNCCLSMDVRPPTVSTNEMSSLSSVQTKTHEQKNSPTAATAEEQEANFELNHDMDNGVLSSSRGSLLDVDRITKSNHVPPRSRITSTCDGTADSSAELFQLRTAGDTVGSLCFALQYDYRAQALCVDVREAKNLHLFFTETNQAQAMSSSASLSLTPNSYVKTYLLPDKTKTGKRKTKVRKHSTNPVFHEKLKYFVGYSELESRTLLVSVWHRSADLFQPSRVIGELRLPFVECALLFSNPEPQWYKLNDFKRSVSPMCEQLTQYRGALFISVKYVAPSHVNITNLNKIGSKGELHCWLKEARHLVATRATRSPDAAADPFAKVYLLPDRSHNGKRKTPIACNTCDPSWNVILKFEDVEAEELNERALEVTVWDKERLGCQRRRCLGGIRASNGSGKCHGEAAPWMDSSGDERRLWLAVLERPNTWIDGTLLLRHNLNPFSS